MCRKPTTCGRHGLATHGRSVFRRGPAEKWLAGVTNSAMSLPVSRLHSDAATRSYPGTLRASNHTREGEAPSEPPGGAAPWGKPARTEPCPPKDLKGQGKVRRS